MNINEFIEAMNEKFLNPRGKVYLSGFSHDIGILKSVEKSGEKCVLFIFQKEIVSCNFPTLSLIWHHKRGDVQIKWEEFWIADKNFSTIYWEVKKIIEKKWIDNVIRESFPPRSPR